MSATPESLLALDRTNDSKGAVHNWSPFHIIGTTLALLGATIYLDDSLPLRCGFIITALVAIAGALWSNRMYHYIIDTPLSNISSAAQGFVELSGICDLYGNRQSQGFASGPPCVWHQYSIRSVNNQTERGASSLPFSLTDASGVCKVDPHGAMLLSSSKRTWKSGANLITSNYIRPGATVYVLGELRTRGGADLQFNKGLEVSTLLTGWKKDKQWLMEEFDRNGDGNIDLEEWEVARARAEKISHSIHQQRSTDPVEHVIAKPSNGMPFIISDTDPAPLGRLFQAICYANALIAAGCFVWFCLQFS